MDVLLHSELSVDECLSRLEAAIDRPRWFEYLRLRDHENPAIGRIRNGQFQVIKRPYGGRRNSWAPVFSGQMAAEPDGRGTRIEGHIGVADFVRVFMTLWLGFAGVMAVAFPIAAVVASGPWFMAVIPFGLLAFGFGLSRRGTKAGKSDEPFLLDYVSKTLEAEPVAPGAADG